MPNPIIARVELHEKPGEKPDYDVLKQNMARWKFTHYVRENGVLKLLPTGTYARTEACPIDLAKDMVEFAADLTGFTNCGIVVGDEGLRTFDLSALPSRHWLMARPGSAPSSAKPSALSPPPAPPGRGLYGTRQ